MKRIIVFLLTVFTALALFTTSPVAHAADQVVSDCGDNGGANQLRAKINAANSSGGGTITFTCGPSVILKQGVLPTITTNITINGGGTITISGNNASRIFVTDTTLTLNNITLSNGYINGDDGAAIRAGGTLNINNSKFLNHTVEGGGSGGAIVAYGALDITNSEFAYNKAANGGALYLKWGNAKGNISGSNFHDNQTTDTTNGWGGAILLFDGASATASSTTFNLNQALQGGAVYVYSNSSLTLNNNSTMTNNKAIYGGSIHNSGTATLTNSSLSGNKAEGGGAGAFPSGGGIFNGATLILTHVTLNANEAADEGGGLLNVQTATLTNVTLSGNKAGVGGGIRNRGKVTLTNSTFSSNSAVYYGGGLADREADAWLSNVTFSGNSAPQYGGIATHDSDEYLKNTLLAKGASGANCDTPLGGSFNLSDDGSCGFGAGRDNVTNLNLGALANNGGFTKTHLPGAGSAAIDQAQCTDVNGNPVAKDQRGVSRPKGLGCDVGAVEVQAVGCTAKPAAFPANPVSPANGSTVTVRRVPLKWNARKCAEFYRVQVRVGSTTGPVVDKSTVVKPSYKTVRLRNGLYYWQVKACNWFGCRASAWWSFVVRP